MQMNPEDRAAIAQHRFEEFAKLVKASGCAVTPDPKSLAVNFTTGEHVLILQVNRDDPRQIGLVMILTNATGDLEKARAAAVEVTGWQFASKATVEPYGNGFQVKIGVGVYAEAAHAFGDSLKAYVDDVVRCYNDFIDVMIR